MRTSRDPAATLLLDLLTREYHDAGGRGELQLRPAPEQSEAILSSTASSPGVSVRIFGPPGTIAVLVSAARHLGEREAPPEPPGGQKLATRSSAGLSTLDASSPPCERRGTNLARGE